jgi:hypothetical protein
LIAAVCVAFQVLVEVGVGVPDAEVADGLGVEVLIVVGLGSAVAGPVVQPVSRASAIMQPVRGSRRGSVIGAPFFSLAH